MTLANSVQKDKPFVIFKKPGSFKVSIWQQKDSGLYTSGDLSEEGYYFAPFDFDSHRVVVFPKNKIKIHEKRLTDFTPDDFLENRYGYLWPEISNSDPDEYKQKVKRAVNLIHQGKLQKIVLSRPFKVMVSDFDIFDTVLRLMWLYDYSYVYLWHHPDVGTWMGATPELLADFQNGYFKTVSLAGTVSGFQGDNQSTMMNVKYGKNTLLKEDNMTGSWGNKEFHEQQIVTDYIAGILKKYSPDVEISKPGTVRQGHLEHIKTGIIALIKPSVLGDVVRYLHPTPAVCGLPVETAKYYIKQIENYNRKYYTGFLGEKNKQSASLHVNLRCMEVCADRIVLYVGGGIVADSNPDKEWQEILLKSEVLLSGLNKRFYI